MKLTLMLYTTIKDISVQKNMEKKKFDLFYLNGEIYDQKVILMVLKTYSTTHMKQPTYSVTLTMSFFFVFICHREERNNRLKGCKKWEKVI